MAKMSQKGLNCDSTSSICQDVLKSDNLLYKQGFVASQLVTIVAVQNTPSKKLRIGENPTMHRTVRKHENHGAIDIVVLYHPLSSSTVFTAASFNSVVVEPHFKCGYTIKESSLLLLTYYYTSTVYVLLVCAMVLQSRD